MNNNVFTAVCFFIILLTPILTWGASDSVNLNPLTSKQTMVLCPIVSINGTQLTSGSQTVDLGPPTCTSGYNFGTAAIVAWAGGVNFNGHCPPDAPYIGGFSEDWPIVVVFDVGGMGSTLHVTCCNFAQPPMSLTQSSTTWQSGTFCQ